MDVLAGLLELLAIWMLGSKQKNAFLVYNVANIFWIWSATQHHMYGLYLVAVPAIFLNIRNYIKWRSNEKS